MSVLKRFLSLFTGNTVSQALLERNVRLSHYLMGVGCGSKVQTSGELAIARAIDECPRQPCRVFDVGANTGQFSTMVLQHCQRSDFELHCFEPGKAAFSQLANKFLRDPRFRLNHFALGAEAGTATLFADQVASGLSSLTQRDLRHVGRVMDQSETVKVCTLDDYCQEKSIDRIDVLKIDVEGHEWEVLEGAKRMFAEKRIDLATFEFGGTHVDTRHFMREFFYFFNDQQMSLYRITPRGFLRHLPKYNESLEQFVTTNFLARRAA